MRGFFMGEPFTGSPADLQYISYDENTTAKQLVDNMNGSVAPVETTSTASRPYTVGKRLTYRGQLYKVTQAIAQGGTLTPGTNIAVDSVDDELTAINTNLSAKSPYFDWVEIATTTTALTVNVPMVIDAGTSSVVDGSTSPATRPTDRFYIPVVVNAQNTSAHHTSVVFSISSDKWVLVTDVKQNYRIIFYKVPRK